MRQLFIVTNTFVSRPCGNGQTLEHQEKTEMGFDVINSLTCARKVKSLCWEDFSAFLFWNWMRFRNIKKTGISFFFFLLSFALHCHQILGEVWSHILSINIFTDLFSCFRKLYLFLSHKKSITMLGELKVCCPSKERTV